MNPLASLNSLASRTTHLQPRQDVQDATRQAYTTLSNRLADKLGLEPEALQSGQDDFSPQKVADRVLGFIEQRLTREAAAGADPAKLQGLLSQARDGVEKGFAEARKILDGLGVLTGQVAKNVDDTYDRIQSGLADLDKRFAPQQAPSAQYLATAKREQFSAVAQTFDLNITTRDGDRLRVSVAQASAAWSQSSAVSAGDGNGHAAAAAGRSGSVQIGAWQVEVEGELDADEIRALEDLFGQVQTLSDQFYAGDVAGAFDRALALKMDGGQLASMSLNLTQTSVRQVTESYGAVSGQGVSAINPDFQDYVQGLVEALRSAREQFAAPEQLLKSALDGGFSIDERFSQEQLEKARVLNDNLLQGLSRLLPKLED